jgi:hypothetical protein
MLHYLLLAATLFSSPAEDSLLRKWKVLCIEAREYIKLPFAPGDIALDSKNNFIVLTYGNLVSIDQKPQISVLVGDAVLRTYYCPHTMVLKDDIAYAGMRTGVLKYDINSAKAEWLVPGNY